MAIEAKEVAAHIRTGLIFAIRTSYSSARGHPFVWAMAFVLLLLYRSFPSLFAFLVSSSPVIVCTTLLLGLLLSYGEPNLPEIEEDKRTQQVSSLKSGAAADDLVVRRDESFAVEAHAVEEEDKKEIHSEAKERQVRDQGFVEDREFSIEKQAESALEVGRDVSGGDQEEIEGGLKVKIAKPATEENRFDSSLGSPWHPINIHDASSYSAESSSSDASISDIIPLLDQLHPLLDSEPPHSVLKSMNGSDAGSTEEEAQHREDEEAHKEKADANEEAVKWAADDQDANSDPESDRAESSSPDASMADFIPLLDELHPLLDCEPPQPVLKCMGGSDAGSAEEEAEHRWEDEEDEEAHEEKADGNEEAVKWTADDQKNVMDLGISEIERNRRLESLIAKRRARRDLRFITERNLIDLDPVPAMEELSRFQVRMPPISAPRQNPFDLPYNSDETMGLPPIPGSAPSVLMPRQNPFDLPYDLVGQSSSLTSESLSHGEFLPVPQREMFFRRHESFSSGAPFTGELKQEKRGSSLKPYFVTWMAEEDAVFATFQRQLSEMSDSKVSSVPESDTASLGIDQEHQKELLEEELHQDSELLSPANHYTEPVEQKSGSSKEVDCDYHGIDSNTSMIAGQTYQAADASRAVEEEIRDGELDSTILDAARLEVIEDKYEEKSSSSFEADEKSSKMSTHEESVNLELAKGDSSKGSSDSMHSLPADSNFPSREGERADDSQVTDPVYDSSPTSIGKSHSNMLSFDEALYDAGKGDLISTPPLASDMQADISEVASSPRTLEKNISSVGNHESVSETMDEDLASVSGRLEVASSNLSSVGENEPRLSEITAQIMNLSSSSSVDTESSEDNPVDVVESFQSEGGELRDASTSYSDTLVLSDCSTSFASEKAQPSMEKSATQPSSEAGLVESQISISNLPSIPEENLEDFKLEEEQEIMNVPAGIVCLTGLQIIEEPDVGLSDIEQELSFFQKKFTEETEDIDNANRLVREPEDDDASVVSPIISSHDSGLTGVRLLETMEGMESSSLLDAKCELEIKSHSISTDSRGDIIGEVQSNWEGGSPNMLKDSYDESDEVHAEVREIEGIDEALLSELDAVGDFRAEEVKSDGGGPEMELQSDVQFVSNGADPLSSPVKQDIPTQLEVSEARSNENAEANSNDSYELPSVVNQPNTMILEVGSSSWPSAVDPEMTVYNSKLHFLEACSFEELDSAFKQFREEAVMPCGSELIVQKSVTTKTEVGCSERFITDRDPKLIETDSELEVLEAKSIEDINSAFEQLSKGGLDKSVLPVVEPSESLAGRMHSEMMGTHSDLQVVEAKSLEDIHLALRQFTDGTAENPLKLMEPKDGSDVVEASQRHLEPEVLEVQSAEEIRLAFEEVVARETGSNHGQSDEKSHGVETMTDFSSSGVSTSRTVRKKDKSAKSGSSSSDSE